MNITERLQYIVDQLFGGNKAAFARAIDIAPTSISNYLGKERASKPSSDILEKIVNSVEQINAYWLLTGKGEAFGNNIQLSTNENHSIKCENESSYIECIRNLTEANLLNAEANNRNSKSLEFLIQSITPK
jgi:hypothetical protein